jgi:hypothetical protein
MRPDPVGRLFSVRRLRPLAIVGSALLACSSGTSAAPSATPSATSAATAACANARSDATIPTTTATVAGAFTLRAADLAQQDETPRGGPGGPHPLRSFYRDYPPDTPIVLCFFDGPIAAPGGPPPQPPATFRPYDRYVVTIAPSSAPRLAMAGRRDTVTVAPRLP